jgi:hypothetical protein
LQAAATRRSGRRERIDIARPVLSAAEGIRLKPPGVVLKLDAAHAAGTFAGPGQGHVSRGLGLEIDIGVEALA